MGKIGGENVRQIYYFRVFGKKLWQINRSAKRFELSEQI